MADGLDLIAPGLSEAGEAEQRDTLNEYGKEWLGRLDEAEKREKNWLDDAARAEAAYSCDEDSDAPDSFVPDFNILHSNIETICPSLYNSTPRPDVRPRHNAMFDNIKEFTDVMERAVLATIDDGKLDTEMEDLVRDAELAGRGIIWVQFNANDELLNDDVVEPEIIYDSVAWRDFRCGPATKWRTLPWAARRHCLTAYKLRQLEDEVLRELQIDPESDPEDLESDERYIWEIWDKETRTQILIEDETGLVISVKPDPLGLKDFFPFPPPVQPITITGKLTPTCPYRAYDTLAAELDLTTRRINALLKILKVRGIIAGGIAEDIARLAEADDGDLITATDLQSLVSVGGLDKGIIWWPISEIIAVIRELMQQREAIKATIYEVTGISDIVRGASNAGETATAQQIKTQWGSLRIKKLQGMIQRAVRDTFKIAAEIMAKHFPPEYIAEMAGVALTPELAQVLSQPFNHMRIDVESDSTIRADLTMRREEMSGFLQATGAFLQVAQPMMQQEPKAVEPLMEIYASFARQYNLGKQAEDAIDGLIMGAKALAQEENPEEAKQKAEEERQRMEALQDQEMEIKRMEAQSKMMDSQTKAMEAKAKMEIEADRIELEQRRLSNEEIKILDEMEQTDGVQEDQRRKEEVTMNGATELDQLLADFMSALTAHGDEILEGQNRLASMVMEGQQAIASKIIEDEATEEDQPEGELTDG